MGGSSEGSETVILAISLIALPYSNSETVPGGTQRHRNASSEDIPLFPLNGRRWLWSDVVGYAVNTGNFTDDARRNAG